MTFEWWKPYWARTPAKAIHAPIGISAFQCAANCTPLLTLYRRK